MDEGLSRIFNKQEAKASLGTKIIGRKIFVYDWVTSTNDIAHFLAQKEEADGTVVFAKGQTQGRGRLGRTWISPYNTGLYFSIILRPDMSSQETSRITLAMALAVAEALKEMHVEGVAIKWPNDILIGGKKVCGILTEMSFEAKKTHHVVVGVGFNVNTSASALPDDATSLKVYLRRDFDIADLSHIILTSMDVVYHQLLGNDFKGLIQRVKEFSGLILGGRVRVWWQEKSVEGYAVDFDEFGALVIRRDNGFLEKVSAGHLVKL